VEGLGDTLFLADDMAAAYLIGLVGLLLRGPRDGKLSSVRLEELLKRVWGGGALGLERGTRWGGATRAEELGDQEGVARPLVPLATGKDGKSSIVILPLTA